MNREETIKRLRSKRYTYREIGQLLGISKQRIHQIHIGYKPKYKHSKELFAFIPENWRPIKKYDSKNIKISGRD